jgi:ACS family pantothenate transporter-like MFS transporter
LSDDEKALARSRLNREHPPVRLTLRVLRASAWRIVTDWRWYLFSALFAISATSFEKTGVYSEFLLWLESTGHYSTAQVNYYPSIFTAVAIVSTYGLTVFSNLTGSRAIINPIMWVLPRRSFFPSRWRNLSSARGGLLDSC